MYHMSNAWEGGLEDQNDVCVLYFLKCIYFTWERIRGTIINMFSLNVFVSQFNKQVYRRQRSWLSVGLKSDR